MDKPHHDFEVFPWNENLETNIPIVDEQHKELVELLNQLSNTLVGGGIPELENVFNKLAAYAEYHFKTEEAVWAPYFGDDPWFSSHQQSHSDFLPMVLQLKEEQGDRPLHDIVEHIVKFLIRWLAFHIIDHDKRMAFVVHNIEAGMPLEMAKVKAEEHMEGSTKVLIDTVLKMYDGLSSRTLELMRERVERIKVEEELLEANRNLEKMAITDQLTGLYNRHYFVEVFSRELGRARREQRFLSFIMFDVDNFKQLNDHYGHLQGDAALRQVAESLRELCRRPGDYVFRLGGEEFGVLVTDQTSQHCTEMAEQIRATVEGLQIPHEGSSLYPHLTVSVGVIAKVPTEIDDADSFIRAADGALYRAKDGGKNRVVVA